MTSPSPWSQRRRLRKMMKFSLKNPPSRLSKNPSKAIIYVFFFYGLIWDMTNANNKIKVIYLKPVLLKRALGPSGLPKLVLLRCDK